MPFHVEIRRSLQRAREFNLEERDLRARVVEPWLRGATVRLGGREWEPGRSTLCILEGALLPPEDLAHSQGWHRAERTGRDVTSTVLAGSAGPPERARIAALAGGDVAERFVASLLAGAAGPAMAWPAARRALMRGDARLTAGVAVLSDDVPDRAWVYGAGLLLGALGSRATVAVLGEQDLPAELAGVEVVRLDPRRPGDVAALRERLLGRA